MADLGPVGPHFLDAVNKRRVEKNEPRDSITRLFYVASWRDTVTPVEAGAAHEKMINGLDDQAVSGLMILQSESLVNLVETKENIAMDLLRKISESTEFQNVRVVVSAEDCPSRIFQDWTYREVKTNAEPDVDLGHEDLASSGFSLYSKILKIGKALSNLSSADCNESLDILDAHDTGLRRWRRKQLALTC